jgi:hypothetical protein
LGIEVTYEAVFIDPACSRMVAIPSRYFGGFRRADRSCVWSSLLDLSRHRPLLWLVLGLLVSAFGVAEFASLSANVGYCDKYELKGPSDPYWLALIGIGGFVGGRILGHARSWDHPNHSGVRTHPWLQILLAMLLTLAGGALLYESHGLGHWEVAPPITSYIRCAAAGQVALTAIAAGVLFILLGGWLWRPTASAAAGWVTLAAVLILAALVAGLVISPPTSTTAALSGARGYWRWSFVLVSAFVFCFPLAAVIADLWSSGHHRWAVGHYVNEFVRTYPWFALCLGIVVGAMIAHFFLGLVGRDAVLSFLGRLI